ncbi:MotA/TolQ/ExbB proton channel family protein [Haloferula chungangensis]|uniref:MotA/TolQ/ExbB proton channel family protein n=1 Tax=Haloferula chungangensis TaxID=1048331 RepID=A0ABW2L5D4_9BACT
MKKALSDFACLLIVIIALSSPEKSSAAELNGNSVVAERSHEASVGGAGVLISKFRQTGMTGVTLLLISVVGFSFAFERAYHLRKVNIVPERLTGESERLWKAGDFDALRELSRQRPSTLSRVILMLVDHREGSHTDVANLAGDMASREMRIHLQRAYPLAVVATVSPLLGLFGTVYGMIGAFESVALAGKMGDPSIMAGDISFALMTTAIGLVIAVPALTAYHFFRVRTNILGLALEEQVNHLLIRWFPIGK